jgi:hypothetical protein
VSPRIWLATMLVTARRHCRSSESSRVSRIHLADAATDMLRVKAAAVAALRDKVRWTTVVAEGLANEIAGRLRSPTVPTFLET